MFYITISNGLLQGDHRKRMGSAVWEFMWCIDKVTRIDEDGTGWVLGGKPIKLDDLADQMSVSRDTVSRNLISLEEEGYIKKTITPYGIVIKVCKIKKRFRKNVEPSSAQMSNLRPENAEPNKTVSVDKAVRHTDLRKRSSGSEEVPEPEITTVGLDGDGQEVVEKKKGSGRMKNYAAMRIVEYFSKKAREYTGKPIIGHGYSVVDKLMRKGMDEATLTKVVDGFFSEYPPDEKAGNLYVCFSVRNVNKYIIGS